MPATCAYTLPTQVVLLRGMVHKFHARFGEDDRHVLGVEVAFYLLG